LSCLEATGVIRFAPIDISAAGDTTLVAPVTGRKIRVLALALVPDAAVAVTFKSGSSKITGPVRLVDNLILAAEVPWGCFECSSGQPLVLNLSAAVQVSGWLSYQETK